MGIRPTKTQLDRTVRTVAEARRSPQWQRLIDTVHKEQKRRGFAGLHWGTAEQEFFGVRLIGFPARRPRAPFDHYFVERTMFESWDGDVRYRFKLCAVYGDNPAEVRELHEKWSDWDPSEDELDELAKEFVSRKNWQVSVDDGVMPRRHEV